MLLPVAAVANPMMMRVASGLSDTHIHDNLYPKTERNYPSISESV